MKITGYKLREALKMLELKRDGLTRQFEGSLTAFPEEVERKRKPAELAEDLQKIEASIALHQAAQSEYNLKVEVSVEGEKMSLAQAVKTVGGVTRMIELWKSADREISSSHERVRVRRKEDEHVYAQPQVKPEEVLTFLEKAEKRAAALRGAIAHGNSEPVDIELDLKPA